MGVSKCGWCDELGLKVDACGDSLLCFYHLALSRGFNSRMARSYIGFLSGSGEMRERLPSQEEMRLIALMEDTSR